MLGPIDFSNEALTAFKDRCDARQPLPKAIRLGVRGGACSGFQYVIEFDDGDLRSGDVEWIAGDVTFRLDRKSRLYLSGSRVTWTKNLMYQGFNFENPHEASKCGCGSSFNVK